MIHQLSQRPGTPPSSAPRAECLHCGCTPSAQQPGEFLLALCHHPVTNFQCWHISWPFLWPDMHSDDRYMYIYIERDRCPDLSSEIVDKSSDMVSDIYIFWHICYHSSDISSDTFSGIYSGLFFPIYLSRYLLTHLLAFFPDIWWANKWPWKYTKIPYLLNQGNLVIVNHTHIMGQRVRHINKG